MALASYLLNAVVSVIDKFLITHKERGPLVYAFFVGILSPLGFILWFFDFSFLPAGMLAISLASGAAFFGAIYFFYKAIGGYDISRVVALIGGVSPLVLMVLSYFFIGERLPVFWILGVIILISGGILLTFGKNSRSSEFEIDKKMPFYSLLAAILFSFSFFLTKIVFLNTGFFNGFAWVRVGSFLPALIALLFPAVRGKIFASQLKRSPAVFSLFIFNKTLSAGAFLILNYAFMLGSITIVSALQGAQYFFLFIITLVLFWLSPNLVKEKFTLGTGMQKFLGIALVSLGIIVLFIT